jgi:hypothetical protein
MNKLFLKLFVCAYLVGNSSAQTITSNLYWKSVAFSAAGTGFDVVTSWNRLELNPIMRGKDGRFGTKAVSLKVGALIGTVFIQKKFFRRHHRLMTIVNFSSGSLWFVYGGLNLVRR